MAFGSVYFRGIAARLLILLLLSFFRIFQRFRVVTQEVDQPHSLDFSDACVEVLAVLSDELPDALA